MINHAKDTYEWSISMGIAKEQARAVLPEGLTSTRLYMAGTLRSWIHYIDVRAEAGTQKEHREVALAAQQEILKHFPSLEDYWNEPRYEVEEIITKVPLEEVMREMRPWWKFWS